MIGNGFLEGGNVYNQVNDMVEFYGKLYIVGNFDRLDGLNLGKNMVVWNGENWEEMLDIFSMEVSYGGNIYIFEVFKGELYVGGFFDCVGELIVYNFVKFDGFSWCVFQDSLF